MPSKPFKPCNYHGCLRLTREGYCDEHARVKAQQYDQQRGTAAQRGYDARWRRYRVKYLAENPYCVECLKHGKFVFATVVDHIKPHKGDKKLFWDPDNHQPLCRPCHDRKTATEDGGFGNTPRV